jgi:hypothetical protein
MSTTVWPYTLLRPYSERAIHQTTREALNNGHEQRRPEYGTYGQMRVDARLRLPYGGYTIDDFSTFVVARQGGYDTFLYKCLLPRHRTQTDEAVGTGDGSDTTFYLDMKYIDSSTLVVKVNGSTQTGGGTHYTFSGNNTAPLLTFVSAPGNGLAVTATYDYYYPMRLIEGGDDPNLEQIHATGAHSTTVAAVRSVVMLEDSPGAHRA